MKKLITLFVSLLRVAFSISATAQSNVVPDATEFQVLKTLFDSLGGASWVNVANWPAANSWPSSATSAQFGTWTGVTVTNGDISSLTLNGKNLTGPLPAAIGALARLK